MVLLTINVVVHPVSETSSPGAGGMWRWAVHVGDDWVDPTTCLNAGCDADPSLAALHGAAVAVACARVAERCDAFAGGTSYQLDYDPCGEPWALVKVEDF